MSLGFAKALSSFHPVKQELPQNSENTNSKHSERTILDSVFSAVTTVFSLFSSVTTDSVSSSSGTQHEEQTSQSLLPKNSQSSWAFDNSQSAFVGGELLAASLCGGKDSFAGKACQACMEENSDKLLTTIQAICKEKNKSLVSSPISEIGQTSSLILAKLFTQFSLEQDTGERTPIIFLFLPDSTSYFFSHVDDDQVEFTAVSKQGSEGTQTKPYADFLKILQKSREAVSERYTDKICAFKIQYVDCFIGS